MSESVAVPPRADSPVLISASRRNTVFVTVALGMLLAALDQTIVATALPTIVGDLGGAEHLSWVVTSYLLAQTISTALAGKFGDLFGRKLVFQLSVVVFVGGSAFCGLAESMTWLIAWRAVQGFAAGGLMVTAAAVIGDVIPLRDRGKYQGALGSVFGVVTVIGPLLGGLFTDHLSWHWVFYINVPVGILVFVVGLATMPSVRSVARPLIDWWGILLIALGAAGLTLVTSWGGTTYEWTSPTIIWMSVGSVVALALFVFAESRAREPMLPLRLFANPVFTMCGVLSFLVGFAMLGGMTYLPTYMQYVQGVSATESGLRLLPMVIGLLTTSLASGALVSRTGRYKIFPILGAAVMVAGFYLLSRLDAGTSFLGASLAMLVLGAGIGLMMQVLIIVVQSTVSYADLGVATSGVTFLRTIGSSFGVAVFGTIYANNLSDHLTSALAETPLPAGTPPQAVQSPELLWRLPEAIRANVIDAYADTIQTVFLSVTPIAVVALICALFLPERPLRDSAKASAADLGEGFAMPEAGTAERELERAISVLWRKQPRDVGPEILARADIPMLDAADAWMLWQIYLHSKDDGTATMEEIAQATQIPAGIFAPSCRQLVARGYLDEVAGAGTMAGTAAEFVLSERGRADFTRLVHAWRDWLAEQLADWQPQEQVDLVAALDRQAERIIRETSGMGQGQAQREPVPAQRVGQTG
ncbi:MDR family MFS transporter [Flindersiella endophytica]